MRAVTETRPPWNVCEIYTVTWLYLSGTILLKIILMLMVVVYKLRRKRRGKSVVSSVLMHDDRRGEWRRMREWERDNSLNLGEGAGLMVEPSIKTSTGVSVVASRNKIKSVEAEL